MPKIADVIHSLEPKPSKYNTHRSVSDLAIAKFKTPVRVYYGHRPIMWDLPPNSERARAYLLGGTRHGQLESLPQSYCQVQEVTSAFRGGLSYLWETLLGGASVDYEVGPAVLW